MTTTYPERPGWFGMVLSKWCVSVWKGTWAGLLVRFVQTCATAAWLCRGNAAYDATILVEDVYRNSVLVIPSPRRHVIDGVALDRGRRPRPTNASHAAHARTTNHKWSCIETISNCGTDSYNFSFTVVFLPQNTTVVRSIQYKYQYCNLKYKKKHKKLGFSAIQLYLLYSTTRVEEISIVSCKRHGTDSLCEYCE